MTAFDHAVLWGATLALFAVMRAREGASLAPCLIVCAIYAAPTWIAMRNLRARPAVRYALALLSVPTLIVAVTLLAKGAYHARLAVADTSANAWFDAAAPAVTFGPILLIVLLYVQRRAGMCWSHALLSCVFPAGVLVSLAVGTYLVDTHPLFAGIRGGLMRMAVSFGVPLALSLVWFAVWHFVLRWWLRVRASRS